MKYSAYLSPHSWQEGSSSGTSLQECRELIFALCMI